MTQPGEDARLDALVDLIVQLAAGDLTARLDPSPARDAVDAVITGINLLADELDNTYQTLEQRVIDRTALLDQARRELERMAFHDPMTGLANRSLLSDRIEQACARADRGGRPPCVFLLDLDEFKTINDGLGHGAGDVILVEVARRLTGVVRATDTVGRLGGDEFAVLLLEVTEDEALRIAQRALQEMQRPFTVANRTVWAGASIGLCFGVRGHSADLLLRDADTAMYAAKARGRGNVQVFRPHMHRAASERLQVASELGVAITAGQLTLHYQPVVELATGRIIGAEALVRWRHPHRGLLLPVNFISVAEDSGHIIELGHWVLQSAIGQLRCWQRQLPSSFQLHVNLSPVEVRWPGLATFVADTLAQHRVPPHQLALEISETGVMTGDAGGLETLLTLKKLGIGIEIDDFGTGYSSISYLRRLPIDTVKVDQSLITDIAVDAHQATFVGAVLRLIESVQLRAVVEGIESTPQLEQLIALGCDYGQGHLFSEAVPADQMIRLLLDRAPGTTPTWR